MTDWKSRVGADPIDWLLEEKDPTVRYLALRDLMRVKGKELAEAKGAIMASGPVPKILAKQQPEGHWGRPEDFYVRSKYKGTVWNLILLAELCADPEDERVRAACEFVLDWSQERSSGGFSSRGGSEKGGNKAQVISCLTGNMCFALVRLGYADDPRVKRAARWLTTYMRYEHTSQAAKEWPYIYERCWHDHTCRSGAVKSLKALAEIPSSKRTADMERTIEQGAEFLLSQQIIYDGPGSRQVARPEWLRLGFPLMWNSDVLEILDILTRLGYQDERMHDALMALISKRGADGRWLQENRFQGRFLVSLERNGRPSKWVTLRALRVLDTMPR